MEAADLFDVIQNDRTMYESVYQRCYAILAAAVALPGMATDPGPLTHAMPTADLGRVADLIEKLGDTVKAMVWERARREHGVTDRERTFTETMLAVAVNGVSTSDLGRAFYTSTRDRYAHGHTRAAR